MIKSISAKMFKDMFISGSNNLQNHKDLVDKLNVFPVPDGDTGTNMSLTISSAIKELDKVNEDNLNLITKAISKGSLMGARGNSGVILSQIIRGLSKSLEDKDTITVKDLANALKNGSDTAYKAVIKPIEGTILTVVRESSEYALKISNREEDVVKFLEEVIKEANASLERTPDLLKNLKDAGVVDSGGKGLVLIYEGMLKALKDDIVELTHESEQSYDEIANDVLPVNIEDIKFAYCTEFILETNKIDDIGIRDLMLPLGDSLAVVGYDGIIKVHVHTNTPNKALEIALNYGSLVTIKIENMKVQHANLYSNEEVESEMKKYGFISTSMGDGLATIFKDMGVDYIIEGGQTMNPSTEDFLKAIDKINAENIIILPNNSNIIMSAKQTKELSDKNIIVIPTKTTPQGFTALINFDESLTPDENEKNMNESLSLVQSGQVTYAVRDTVMNDVEIKKDDFIGMANSKMSYASKNLDEVTINTIDELINEDSYIITLFYGEDVTEENALSLKAKVQEKYDELDVEIHYGGQPLYYYLISVE